MIRGHLGLLALDALLLAAGAAILYGIGFVRSGREALRHAGLGLFVGWAAVGVAASLALVAGSSLGARRVALIVVIVTAAGLALGRRVPSRPLRAVGEAGRAHWVAVVGAAILLVQLTALLRRALGAAMTREWDAWAFWLPKAKSIVAFGGLDTREGGFTSFAHPYYPPFVPAMEASAFEFIGGTTASLLPFQHWIVAAAFFAGLASLLSSRVRPSILWPSLAFLSLLPMLTRLIGSSLGDEALVLLAAIGGVCLALWLIEREARFAALSGLFLSAAALTKNEGLPIVAMLASVALVAAIARPPRRPLVPFSLLLAPVLAVLPWRLWLHLNGVPIEGDYRLSDALDLGLLADRADRLAYAGVRLPGYVLDPAHWLLAVPLALAAALLAAPRSPALALLAVTPVAAVLVGLLVVYWIGFPPVEWYVRTSALRTVSPAVVLSVAILPLLLAASFDPERAPP